jgi:hypothetical protein
MRLEVGLLAIVELQPDLAVHNDTVVDGVHSGIIGLERPGELGHVLHVTPARAAAGLKLLLIITESGGKVTKPMMCVSSGSAFALPLSLSS